jgi:NTE family protein
MRAGHAPRALCAIVAVLIALAGCASRAHYPINPPLAKHDPGYGYRLENLRTAPDNSGEVLVVLLFSGGGTRASALAYGALEALRDTKVVVGGKERTLLSEVDYISAVSGGAVVAAYYGLYRDRIFQDFGDKFLYRNVQAELVAKLWSNLYKVTSPRYGRGDLFAEYLDADLFEGMTYRDLAKRARPFIAISATDISLGSQFVFSQGQFDLLCSDLAEVPIARAVAASAALPPYLSPITLWNYAGSCAYQRPPHLTGPVGDDARRRQDRAEVESYLDRQHRPHVHLLDGGLLDNLALRQPMGVVLRRGGIVPVLEMLGFADLRYAVFISVDAERDPRFELDRSADVPGPLQSLDALSNVLNVGSFEATLQIEESLALWEQELRESRRPGAPEPQFFSIDMSLRAIADLTERHQFMDIPTALRLDRKDVDDLRALAGRLLRDSPDFQRLMKEIGASNAAAAKE